MDSGFKVEPETVNIIIIGGRLKDRCAIGNILFRTPLESQKSKFSYLGAPRHQLLCKTLRREGEQVFNIAILPELSNIELAEKLRSRLIQRNYKTKLFLFVTFFEEGLLYTKDEEVKLVRRCCGTYKTRIIPVVLCSDKKPDYDKVLDATTWFQERYFDIHIAPAFFTKTRRDVITLYGNDLWSVIDLVLQGNSWAPEAVALNLEHIILGDGVSLITRFEEILCTPKESPTPVTRDLEPSDHESPEQVRLNYDLNEDDKVSQREKTIFKQEKTIYKREKTIYKHTPPELTEQDYQVYNKVVAEGVVPSLHIRINVLGPNGAGKTTLIKRLQGELNKASPFSVPTKGLEINKNSVRCIEEEDGSLTWEPNAEGFLESLMTDRMAGGIKKEIDLQEEQTDNPEINYTRTSTQELYSDSTDDPDGSDSSCSIDTCRYDPSTPDICSDRTLNMEDEESERMKNVYTTVKHSKSQKVYFSFWDFAGQASYYGMHQLFLSPNSINILVINLSKGLDEKLAGNSVPFSQSKEDIDMTQREAIEFWVQSICTYSGESKVPVIIVFTHIDLIPKEDVFQIAEVVEEIVNLNGAYRFFIDNTKDRENDERLLEMKENLYLLWKEFISEEEIPSIWMQYEEIIQQETGKFVTFENLLGKLLGSSSHDDRHRLECFLRYQHCQGRLLYSQSFQSSDNDMSFSSFENPLILLDPSVVLSFLNNIMYKEDWKRTLESKRLRGKIQADGTFDKEYIEMSVRRLDSNLGITEHLDLLLCYLERMHILVKLKERGTDYYFLPCLLTRMPRSCSFVHAVESTITMTITFTPVCKHYSLFFQLISALSTDRYFEIFTDGKERHIYRKCACFSVNNKLLFLHVQMVDNDIFFKIHNYDHRLKFGNKEEVDICNSVLKLIRQYLNMILAMYPVCIEPEFRIVCPKHDTPPLLSTVSVDDLLAFGNQLCKPNNDDMHTVEKSEILKHWFSMKRGKIKPNEKQIDDFVPMDKDLGRICIFIVERRVGPELLATKLKLPNSCIQADAIIRDNPNNTALQLLEILFLWKREFGDRAAIFEIGKALQAIGLTKYSLLKVCRKKARVTGVDPLSVMEKRKPNQTDFVELCDVIMASKLEFLFLELDITKAQIDRTKHDEIGCRGQMLKLFSLWLEKRGDDASFREILNACIITEMNIEVTQKIRSLLNTRISMQSQGN